MSDIIDVAKLAKVSTATVSRFLNKPEVVKSSTRKRIQEAIKELGYRPSPIAQSMRRQATKYIALVLEDMSNPFYTEVLNGAEYSALENGYNIVVLNINKEQDKKNYYFDIIYRRGFTGVIYCFTMHEEDEEILKKLNDEGVHFALIENELFKEKYTCINTNNYKGGYQAAEYLLKNGHKQIAAIGASSFHDQMNSRKEGFIDCLKDNSVDFNQDLLFETSLSIDGGIKIGEDIYNNRKRFTAVFSFSDIISIGLMRYLKSKSINIPDEISLLSFDDIEWAKIVTPPLTTVHQRKRKLGLKAVESVVKSINGDLKQESIILDTYIIDRETVKDINQ